MPLRTVNGLEILELRGRPADMGTEHGSIMRERIQRGIAEFFRKSEDAFEVPHDFLCTEARRFEQDIPDCYLEELRAIAKASSTSYDELLAVNCIVDIDAFYMQRILQCCNFVILPPATAHGQVIHGRNLDFPHLNMLSKLAVGISRIPADGAMRPTLSVSWVGFVGLLTGCNASRISTAVVTSPHAENTLQGLPISMLLRRGLEKSDDLDAFYKCLDTATRPSGGNLAVCAGRGPAACAIEFSSKQCERRPAVDGALVVDNVCLTEKMGKNRLTYAAGAFRHARIMQLVAQHYGKIDEQKALEFLRDRYDMARANPQGSGYNCICNHDTVQSVLFLPQDGRVLVAHGSIPAPTGPYNEVRLDDLWGAL